MTMTDELLQALSQDLAQGWELTGLPARRPSDNLLAAVILAELFQMPVRHAMVIKRVGRFMWTNFQPVTWSDPEIIVSLPGPASQHFNRVAMDFLQVRERGPRNPRKWYQAARTVMLRFLPALHRMGAEPAESNFVMEWTADIVAHMRRY